MYCNLRVAIHVAMLSCQKATLFRYYELVFIAILLLAVVWIADQIARH